MKVQENHFYKLDNSKEVKVIWKKYDKANISEIGIKYPTAIVDLDRLSGIPLTEEWLIKFGFEKIGRNFTTKDNFIVWLSLSTEAYIFRQTFVLDIKLDSVHQLQNLYFALNNKELNNE